MTETQYNINVKLDVRFLLFPVTLVLIGVIAFTPTLFDRSIGKTDVDKKIHSSSFAQYESSVLLVFFGYAGCVDVCTPRLQELADIYRSIKANKNVEVIFMNVISPTDPELPERFARFFHPDFQGIYPDEEELEILKKELDLYIVRSLFDEDEYDHTSFLFMLQKKKDGYHLRHVYMQAPFDKTLILQDIEQLVGK